MLAGRGRRAVARRPRHGFKDGLGDAASRSSRTLPTDCDQTKGLNAAQDILTANPDVTRHLRRLRPADPRRPRSRQGCRQEAGRPDLVGFDAGPDEVAAIVAGDRARVGRPVPGQDGLARGRDGARRSERRDGRANIDTGTEMVTKDNAADFGG